MSNLKENIRYFKTAKESKGVMEEVLKVMKEQNEERDGVIGEKRLAMRHIIKQKLEEMQNEG